MDISKSRFLITGCNGFVGRYLTKQLLLECSPDNIYGIDAVSIDGGLIKNTMYLDIRDYETVKRIMHEAKPHFIIHLAADITPGVDIENLDEMVGVNIIGTTNIVKSVLHCKLEVRHFINMGTCEEYGGCRIPFSERSELNPISLYSGTKSAAHVLCKMFSNIYDIPITTIMPSLIYGPGQSDRFFITQAIKKLMEDMDFDMTGGEQTRDFIYVDDVASGLIAVCKSGCLCGPELNICSGREYRLKDIILKINCLTGSKSKINFGAVPYRKNEVMRFSCDNSKIIRLTGWRPKVDIEDGLARTVEYCKKQKYITGLE